MNITLFDTAIASDNLGDQIIMDAAREEIAAALPSAAIAPTLASHRYLRFRDYAAQRDTQITLMGGTNALKSHMFVRGNWKLTPLDILLLRNIVLLGVGWQQYQGTVDWMSRKFFTSALSRNYVHSVRDSHSFRQLKTCVGNVVNTSCPTLWNFNAAACARIPVKKAKKVVFALTYYSPHPNDYRIFEYLKNAYEEVYFWPQQARDVPYAKSIAVTGATVIKPTIDAYNKVLDAEDVDFVGARLHGGIRALQRGRRALVLAVDNRAIEIGRDTGLPILSRESLTAIQQWVEGPIPFSIELPHKAIEVWRRQFQ